jgi:hypothetical protein
MTSCTATLWRRIAISLLVLTGTAAQGTEGHGLGGLARTGDFAVAALRNKPAVAWSLPMPRDIDGVALGEGVLVNQEKTGDGALAAFDANSGAGLWKIMSVGGGQPTISSGLVVFVQGVSQDGRASYVTVRAVALRTGKHIWQHDFLRTFELIGLGVADGLVIATPAGSPVTALDLRTGAVKWEAERMDGGNCVTQPAAQGHTIVVNAVSTGTRDDWLVALDNSTGQERWRVHVAACTQPRLQGDLVWVTSKGARAYALADGHEVRAFPARTMGGIAGPDLGIAYTTSGKVEDHDRNRRVSVWDLSTGAVRCTLPAIVTTVRATAGGVLYVAGASPAAAPNMTSETAHGVVHAVDLATCDVLWSVETHDYCSPKQEVHWPWLPLGLVPDEHAVVLVLPQRLVKLRESLIPR